MKSIKKLSVLLMLVSFLFCMVLTPISVARAVETNDTVYVKIRYLRPDSNYTDWNLWVWQPDKDGSQVNFIGEDEQGKFAVVEMPKSANSFNFIVRQGDWAAKATGDETVDLTKGDSEVVITQGDEEVTRSDKELNRNFDKVTLNLNYFRYQKDYDGSNVSISLDGQNNQELSFASDGDYGKVVSVVENSVSGKNAFSIKIKNDDSTAKNINLAYANNKGEINAYLLQDDSKVYYNADEPVRFPEITYFKIDSLNNMTFKVNSIIKDASDFVLKKSGVELPKYSYSISLNDTKLGGTITLNDEIDINSTYTLEKVNYKSLDSSLGSKMLGSKYFENLYKYDGDLGAVYSKDNTKFALWAPTAKKVQIAFYGKSGKTYLAPVEKIVDMTKGNNGEWTYTADEDLDGEYYNYLVSVNGKVNEVVDPYAKAVGVNGNRSMVVNLESTNPEGWNSDVKPQLESPTDARIYEMHIRDFSIDEKSGVQMEYRGKYKGVWQPNTVMPGTDVKTGISHLKELGINVVQIMPAYDYQSVDETKKSGEYNWGYDPQNYNVPEGSYSTNPYDGKIRIKEFKEMVQELHKQGIKVVMDVVYNHTFNTDSCLEKAVPGYYYRFDDDGNFTNGSGCGNETASDHYMFRKYMIDSVKYWVNEYHIDGFRFDLMAVYDIDAMKEVREALTEIDPTILIYGEGWTGGTSALDSSKQALKANCPQFGELQIGMFSDDLRDGLKGNVFNITDPGFLNGVENLEDTIKFGIVGSTKHDDIDYSKVNYSKEPWANEPYQTITYASCHDNNTLWDRLQLTAPKGSESERIQMNKLCASIIWTSQGMPFMQAGEEFARTKCDEEGNLDENSYVSGDYVNHLDWNRVSEYSDLYEYYVGLLKLRGEHKAFRMDKTEDIQKNLTFLKNDVDFKGDNVVAYTLNGKAVGDTWDNMIVMFNSSDKDVKVSLPDDKEWIIVVDSDKAGVQKLGKVKGKITVPAKGSYVLVDSESYSRTQEN
ncbi:type I pullulanase [Clostridium sp. SM-530-WT-3G]|uniref:type I pullulanase n=1 Tax=Clostridium sp. SM-530-WT-3G TaxID=2725303 RepID=UPI00145F63FD|nr:type I pullulanase [Clostridium sp. SM-530-WT-3G]NME84082.1 type I pullulanase [Clostridium sp. SM-530-WT-3G]